MSLLYFHCRSRSQRKIKDKPVCCRPSLLSSSVGSLPKKRPLEDCGVPNLSHTIMSIWTWTSHRPSQMHPGESQSRATWCHRVLQLFLMEERWAAGLYLYFQTRAREDGKGGERERRGSRDTKTDGLIEKENSTPQSNICPLFCITVCWDFQTGHDVAGIKVEISFQPFIHNCYV